MFVDTSCTDQATVAFPGRVVMNSRTAEVRIYVMPRVMVVHVVTIVVQPRARAGRLRDAEDEYIQEQLYNAMLLHSAESFKETA